MVFRFPIDVRGAPPVGLLLLVLAVTLPAPAEAQDPLYLVNESTRVRALSFRFVDHQTFATDRLHQQIATKAPGSFHRLRDWFDVLPFISSRTYPFDPVTLQKDVVRLRRFYQQNGFLHPSIDYPLAQYDTTSNSIHVVFTIEEGPPLIIQDTGFFTADSTTYAVRQFQGDRRAAWIRFRDRTSFDLGERYTEFRRIQIEDQVRTWLRNQGFAFAQVRSAARIDSSANVADIRFYVDPGPLARFGRILVEGNRSVDRSVVLRELPFNEGDRFSASKISQGQRQLFGLNLFRVALADVPSQPRDSTVTVRYRVREASMRTLSGQIGFGAQTGVTTEGSWTHRNFFGQARTLNIGLTAQTGFPENPPAFLPDFLSGTATQEPSRLLGATVTLRQPYLFTPRLSGSLSPFVRERLNNKLAADTTRFLDLNERQFGLNTTLVYDLLPFRTVSLQHSFARTQQFTPVDLDDDDEAEPADADLFDKSVLTLSGTVGKTDDFLDPRRGVVARPSLSLGGAVMQSDVEFLRTSTEMTGYLPLTGSLSAALRLFGGRLWPLGDSRDALTIPLTAPNERILTNVRAQNRFSDFLFYTGGGSNVRGWAPQVGGGKILRPSPIAQDGFVYEPIGGRTRAGLNLELRFGLPGLGPNWQAATFFDAAYISEGNLTLTPSPRASDVLRRPDGTPVASDPEQWIAGTGAGLRFQTPIGFLRLDLAYKLNPDDLDLRRPRDVARAVRDDRPVSSVDARFIRRFRLHFGLGRSF
jgi:outer membrane protein insertion porin family